MNFSWELKIKNNGFELEKPKIEKPKKETSSLEATK